MEKYDLKKWLLYKDYIIKPNPYQLADSKEWTIRVDIILDRGGSVTMRPFTIKKTFPTEAEACKFCYKAGKQIIDGEIPGCSVNDL